MVSAQLDCAMRLNSPLRDVLFLGGWAECTKENHEQTVGRLMSEIAFSRSFRKDRFLFPENIDGLHDRMPARDLYEQARLLQQITLAVSSEYSPVYVIPVPNPWVDCIQTLHSLHRIPSEAIVPFSVPSFCDDGDIRKCTLEVGLDPMGFSLAKARSEITPESLERKYVELLPSVVRKL